MMKNLLEAINNKEVMTTTNNNKITLALKSPLKHLHNERRCFRHPKQPDKAANEVLDFVNAVAAHGVC